jgi:hypothetical protein
LNPAIGILLEASRDEVCEGGRGVRAPRLEVGRWIAENRRQQRGRTCTFERPPPGRDLVQHHTKRENVGAVIDGLPFHLFRRHVRHRAHHDADAGLGDRLRV